MSPSFTACSTRQPFSLVWDYYCQKTGTGVGLGWLDSVKAYEKDVLSGRG